MNNDKWVKNIPILKLVYTTWFFGSFFLYDFIEEKNDGAIISECHMILNTYRNLWDKTYVLTKDRK